MTYVVTRLCQCCSDCVDVCPTDSIHSVGGDPDWPTYYINPDPLEGCIDCAACEAECPDGAIFHGDAVPEGFLNDIQANVDFFHTGPGAYLI